MAKYRILLADSSTQFQNLVRDSLSVQEQIERVDVVNDGQAALERWRIPIMTYCSATDHAQDGWI